MADGDNEYNGNGVGAGRELVEASRFLDLRLESHRVSPTPYEALGDESPVEHQRYGDVMRRDILRRELAVPVDHQPRVHDFINTLERAGLDAQFRYTQLETDVFAFERLPRNHLVLTDIRVNDPEHVYASVYRARCVYSVDILIKEATNYSYNRAMLDREVAMTTRFRQATVPIFSLKLSHNTNLFKLGVRYFRDSLETLMDERRCESNWNVAAELFRVMAHFEQEQVLVRDFRLGSFRVKTSKL